MLAGSWRLMPSADGAAGSGLVARLLEPLDAQSLAGVDACLLSGAPAPHRYGRQRVDQWHLAKQPYLQQQQPAANGAAAPAAPAAAAPR